MRVTYTLSESSQNNCYGNSKEGCDASAPSSGHLLTCKRSNGPQKPFATYHLFAPLRNLFIYSDITCSIIRRWQV